MDAPRTAHPTGAAHASRRIVARVTAPLLLIAATLALLGGALAGASSRSRIAATSVARTPAAVAHPNSHPQLWIRAADLPRLRGWANERNPIYHDGLAALAAHAEADTDHGLVPGRDGGGIGYEEYPTESYAELFAFMSLIADDRATGADYARRARMLLMHVMREAARGPADG